jgi:hypothetical protein
MTGMTVKRLVMSLDHMYPVFPVFLVFVDQQDVVMFLPSTVQNDAMLDLLYRCRKACSQSVCCLMVRRNAAEGCWLSMAEGADTSSSSKLPVWSILTSTC